MKVKNNITKEIDNIKTDKNKKMPKPADINDLDDYIFKDEHIKFHSER